MTVLVTGGAGFIGSHLIDRLLAQGRSIVCVDEFNDYYDPEIKRRNVASALQNPAFRLMVGSITDMELMSNIFAKGDITQVVHLAARAGVRPSLRDPMLYEQVNIQATLHLLELSRQHGIERFIFGSSSSVYGAQSQAPFHEEDPANQPISPYAATKRAGELFCHTYHHLYGLPTTCLRFFTVYGPRQRPDLAIHKFTRALYEGRDIPMYGDGQSARDYTYIDDIVDGVAACLDQTPAFGFEIINLGSSIPITLRDLILTLERITGREARVRQEPDQPGDMRRTYASIEKAARLLKWEPKMPFDDGIRRFAAWFETMHSVNDPR